jgi:CRISPR type III-A-associated RAMP protein Csm4
MKKRRYVAQDTFARVLRGESDAQPSEEAPRLQPEPVLHNRINRLTWGTTEPGRLFYQEQLFLPTNTGLYFLLDVLHESETGLLRACLHLLGHLGWGGNSVSGMNHFTVEIEEKAEDFLPRVDSPTHFVTLSLYFPKREEREYLAGHVDRCWYELVWRRGKIGGRLFPSGHFWKRAVNYFVEGSVFPLIDGALGCFGCNPLVKAVGLKSPFGELHQVRSFGMAFAVPAKVTGVQE